LAGSNVFFYSTALLLLLLLADRTATQYDRLLPAAC